MSKQEGVAVSVLLAATIIYLGANTLGGRDGLIGFVELQRQERELQQERKTLQARAGVLRDRVRRLRQESLDLDYVEERAYVLLAARRNGEQVLAAY
ncbi:MAG: septum formation initiator [Hyphomonadaceae bacterium]|nr:septum formation initiator [Hyphomonadaceae bacterium]